MRAWLISDIVKLVIIGLQEVFTVIQLCAPNSKRKKRTFHWIVLVLLLLLFAYVLILHEPFYVGWEGALMMGLLMQALLCLTALYLGYSVVAANYQAAHLTTSTPRYLIWTYTAAAVGTVLCFLGLGVTVIVLGDSIYSNRASGGRHLIAVSICLIILTSMEYSLIRLRACVVETIDSSRKRNREAQDRRNADEVRNPIIAGGEESKTAERRFEGLGSSYASLPSSPRRTATPTFHHSTTKVKSHKLSNETPESKTSLSIRRDISTFRHSATTVKNSKASFYTSQTGSLPYSRTNPLANVVAHRDETPSDSIKFLNAPEIVSSSTRLLAADDSRSARTQTGSVRDPYSSSSRRTSRSLRNQKKKRIRISYRKRMEDAEKRTNAILRRLAILICTLPALVMFVVFSLMINAYDQMTAQDTYKAERDRGSFEYDAIADLQLFAHMLVISWVQYYSYVSPPRLCPSDTESE
mmetsp:Transcript_3281/g.7670  ORF Transcript_3281/g.7670 Transcript_3281/m.7670 type:complete len:468 (-) Transcript_3281:136-1539(-)|eukprot:CAMPEP_0114525328 /NCGR_PEP_ID=MMETSP0109-20121206/22357_1 /TAXON_ID=29199 /ORGANISM="Chlorarachnion reptans, Strain CCCM449" /LENGTH=467 /DNA_ID=CAMNT_0001706885 /DNA_START=94 /DNA_END=1497 /DNA_ORIENTATION=-